MIFRLTISLLLWILASVTHAADERIVRDTAEQHLRLQTRDLPGKVTLRLDSIDLSRLPACSGHVAVTPQGCGLLGKSLVGVRCLAPQSWSVLVPAHIAVTGNYVTASRPLVAGQSLQAGDLATANSDLGSLPAGVISDPADAIGKTLRASIGGGQPIRNDQLMAPLVIRQGQSVRVISQGSGFSASAEGKSLNHASTGQVTQVRMTNGQTVSGIAQADGSVLIRF